VRGPESDSVAFGENGENVEIAKIAHSAVGTNSQISITYKWRVACCSRVSTPEAGQIEKMVIAGGPKRKKCRGSHYSTPTSTGRQAEDLEKNLRQ